MRHATKIRPKKNERGYALLLVAFAAALMVIAAMTATQNILTKGKREKEKEMIWRGNQYVRGIKLYYRKMGKFPTSLEDLTKPQLGNIRFMRQQYKDPMNQEDGSWRLIYVGPSGQLIGSLKPQPQITLPNIPGATGVGTPAGSINGAGMNGPVNTGFGGAAGTPPSAAPGAAGQTPSAGGVSVDTDANGDAQTNLPAETPTIIGGNIIGVGSKASGRSVIVWDKAKNYRLFEFYWDPSKDTQGFGQPQNIPGAQIPGTSTPGTPAGNPGDGGLNPGLPQNPPVQNPPQN